MLSFASRVLSPLQIGLPAIRGHQPFAVQSTGPGDDDESTAAQHFVVQSTGPGDDKSTATQHYVVQSTGPGDDDSTTGYWNGWLRIFSLKLCLCSRKDKGGQGKEKERELGKWKSILIESTKK